MYKLLHNFQLKKFNTFAIPATAKFYLSIESLSDLTDALINNPQLINEQRLVLGSGSNLLFLKDYDGIIIHPQIQGIQRLKENDFTVEVEVGAGVKWDNFVEWSVVNELYGIENLSLIPGNTGAVPVQNIGAYGVEASSVVEWVTGIDLITMNQRIIHRFDCEFGYRISLFKEKLKENFIVTSVNFRLSKKPGYNLQYEGLESKVREFGEVNLVNVRQAIIKIRTSKLPDPSVYGNAGSFFKNPVVSDDAADTLKRLYPDIPVYSLGSGFSKLAAGWMIEKAGWKGHSFGNAAIHDKQALVIINKGNATGKEIFSLSEMVAENILQKFNIRLEREVQVVG